ncbi:putative flagellar basal-body rod protein flgF [Pseudooceanicola batsensis HTCC2597]|uniref:Flagellar basal-body rod protein FlgF n=1 Tax=Pseudooceanicola batsensis (strain ATCC BAA-863 / DSM 15984 / KCTC 12145 / HTCC2597) TaxID=252305 RepID=A3U104_PSEBH|nr:flagellar basal-body rod protein FlgF [Pseudooceanicola batsensis]EAQ01987.1 putative flagellar basal-body rod protein flgF [Pseudooceanicola batsensis HTCC2597]
MDNTTYVALSLARAMKRDLDVTANNIANANTAGFKAERIIFASYLHQDEGQRVGEGTNFVVDQGSYLDKTQGAMTRTDNPLDLAIKGEAFLSYRMPGGQTAYGRDGQLALDRDGYLVTLSGARVLDEGGGDIAIPPGAGKILISPDGTIASDETGVLGRVGLFDLPDVQSYIRLGNSMLVPPEGREGQATAAEGSEILQGQIELSNVSPVAEVTRLMMIQKAYDRATKLMSTEDELRKDMLRRLGSAAIG